MTALLEVRHLTRVFGRGTSAVRAVDDVSFSLRHGDIVTIVGESGSGKSTLARLVLRLIDPTSGTACLNGRDVTALRGRALRPYWRDVQAVFQDPFSAMNQFFPVARLLRRTLRLAPASSGKGMDSGPDAATTPALGTGREAGRDPDHHALTAETLMTEALAQVGLAADEILPKYPHQLSGGQRQRVMIARALMAQPRILIADEATSMLDASLRANILNVLMDLRRERGMTILFITHDIGQACYVSDRVLVMSRGKLVEEGSAEEVIFHPTHEYTRRLLAGVPRLHESPVPESMPLA